ncbi:MAG: PASTA domain-containing protein, partial [Oscillospiraceae bacterium]
LYEMLTGKVPFDGDTPVSIAIKQMQIEPKHPTLLNPDIPIGLEEIILRSMQKDPQLRYQTAAEMLRDIDEFKHNPSVIFEYKYFNKDGTTKYFNKLDVHNTAAKAVMNEPKKKSYTMNVLAGVAAACVLLAMVALYFFFKGLNNKPGDIVLPNFVGMTVAEAEKSAPDLKFRIIEEQPSPDYDKGVIIEQKTKADTIVKVKASLDVIVSSGLEALTMPDLINETASVAKSRLIAMGIENIEVAQKFDSTIPVGHVMQTDPVANAELKKGDNVVIYVCAGAPDEPIRVPTLIGKNEIEARSELAKAGLVIGKVESVNSTEPKGVVVFQSVDPEKKVNKGTAIDIQISNGVPVITDGNSVVINIPFPAGADDQVFSFDIYVNKVRIDMIEVNPAQGSLVIELKLEDGYINDIVNVAATNEVLILLPNGLFAEYVVDFGTGIATPVVAPDFNSVFSNGYTPTAV